MYGIIFHISIWKYLKYFLIMCLPGLDFNNTCKIYFSTVIKRAKIFCISKPVFLVPFLDAQFVCAIAKESTVHNFYSTGPWCLAERTTNKKMTREKKIYQVFLYPFIPHILFLKRSIFLFYNDLNAPETG